MELKFYFSYIFKSIKGDLHSLYTWRVHFTPCLTFSCFTSPSLWLCGLHCANIPSYTIVWVHQDLTPQQQLLPVGSRAPEHITGPPPSPGQSPSPWTSPNSSPKYTEIYVTLHFKYPCTTHHDTFLVCENIRGNKRFWFWYITFVKSNFLLKRPLIFKLPVRLLEQIGTKSMR